MSIALFNELLFGITFFVLAVTMIVMSVIAVLRYRTEIHVNTALESRIEGVSRHYDALTLRMDMLVTEWHEKQEPAQTKELPPAAKEPVPIQLPKVRGARKAPESEQA